MNRVWPDETLALKEHPCAVCGAYGVELGHITKRAFDRPRRLGSRTVYVEPHSVLPLCPDHHRAYDAHELDLLPYIGVIAQVRAVEDYGSITKALERIAPSLSKRINEPEEGSAYWGEAA